MKTSNYLAKLPQEATIKSIQVLKDYDLISLDVPTASQRPVLTAALTTVLSRTPVPYRLSGTSPVTIAVPLSLSTSAGSCTKTVTPLSMRLPTGSIPLCT